MKQRFIRTAAFFVLGLIPVLALYALASSQAEPDPQDELPPSRTETSSKATPTTIPSSKGDRDRFLRGMTVSCPEAGRIWGSPDMLQALESLEPLGVEWISIHPYSWIGKDGTLRFRQAATLDYLSRAAEMTEKGGFELFLKPHLGYWGSFEWRGAIEFGDDKRAWRRFFDGYRKFIVDQAAFAQRHDVPLFSVGVELEGTTHHEAEWRGILAAVRKVYDGQITYAANWDSVERVPFWDAVDLIGVQAYFPLSSAEDPSAEEIEAGWRGHLASLRELSRRHGGKKVLFAEIGYNRSPAAAREPWDYRVEDSPHTRSLRRRLIDTALAVLEDDSIVAGMFWWKWMPGSGRYRSNFSMRDPEAMAALEEGWRRQRLAR